jgi:hypothetical protein
VTSPGFLLPYSYDGSSTAQELQNQKTHISFKINQTKPFFTNRLFLRGYVSVKQACEGDQKSVFILGLFSFKPLEVWSNASVVRTRLEGAGRSSHQQLTLASGRGTRETGEGKTAHCDWLDFDAACT